MIIYCSLWPPHTVALKKMIFFFIYFFKKTPTKPEARSPGRLAMVASFGGDDGISSAGALSPVALRQFLEYCYCL